MSVQAAEPKLVLCENLTLDSGRTARAHNTVGVIWRVAAIICVLAASILASILLLAQLSEFAFSLDSFLLFGSFTAFTLLAFRTFWIAGTDEFAQSQFYERVAEKEIELKASWDEPEIREFFAAHSIDFPKHPAVQQLLLEKRNDADHFSHAFIPAIAHYKTLRSAAAESDSPIEQMQNGLDQLNLAMLLQSMHRPGENRLIKLDNRFVDTIPGIGRFDKLGVIQKLDQLEEANAFIFDRKEEVQAMTFSELTLLDPTEIRAIIFDRPTENLNQPD